jgi:predicted membrane protein
MEPHARIRITGQLIFGIAIASLGLLFMLDNLDVLRARDFLRYWPVALIVVGIVHIVQARTSAGAVGGIIWLLAGVVLLGSRLDYFDFDLRDYWPVALIALGGYLVWQAFSPNAPGQRGVDSSEMVSAVAVMGGFDRRLTSSEFRGGELTAIMGGGKLDLREAKMVDGQAVINVFALMGGFEILVPETWSLRLEVTPFLGGSEDKTRSSPGPSAPCLIVRGFVMMGGVEFKN